MYIVKRTEAELWTVGEVGSNGRFESYSDHDNRQEAEDQATRLNGSVPVNDYAVLKATVSALQKRIDELEKCLEELQCHVGAVQETYVRRPRVNVFGEY